jgi:ethanolaminephosphotransferase
LVDFKYQGTCASITYKYLWSPFAEFLLKFVPETVAPNLITLFAFVIIVVSHVVFMFEGDSEFARVIPAWKYLLFGVTLFLYQHLDNMDGKQARKTSISVITQKTLQLWGCCSITAAMR